MLKNISELGQEREYPGRFLILGNTKDHFFGVYGVTARSPSSRAKRYVHTEEPECIQVEATNNVILAQGDLTLLDYTAVRFYEQDLILGNGRQVNDVDASLGSSASEILSKSLEHTSVEPDAYETPRITGAICLRNCIWTQAVHIIRRDIDGEIKRVCTYLDTTKPGAHLLSTYAGPNIRPTPSFQEDAIALVPLEGSVQEIGRIVYDAFAPKTGKEDLRVSVMIISISKATQAREYHIINSVDEKRNAYPSVSWMDPRLFTKDSLIEGKGVFTRAPIQKGEVLIRWGGTVYTTQELLDRKTNDMTACQIDDDLYIAEPPETVVANEDLMNHSCDPTTWMEDEVTISARRDIATGEEITADYALWVAYPGYLTISACHCGSPLCRTKVTGDDWQRSEVQERYQGHFPLYLQRRISKKSS